MLAGLLFLGVLAAASFPDMMDIMHANGNDDDNPDDDIPEDAAADQMIDEPFDEEVEDDDQALGEDLFADPPVGRTNVEAFKPGRDTLTIAVPDEAQEFSAREGDENDDAVLRYETDDGTIEIQFEGLTSVPVGDVFLRVPDGGSPTDDADIALSQLIDANSHSAILDPVDPTLPDDPPSPDEGDGRVLSPVDPTLPDDPPAPSEGGPVLYPVEDDGVPAESGDLAALLNRDGGSSVGIGPDAPEPRVYGDGADSTTMSAVGANGTLILSEAAPALYVEGGDVTAVDMGDGDDRLTVQDGATYGFGGAGDDTLSGGHGATALFGGAGADMLNGGAADDGQTMLNGGAGDDQIFAGIGGALLDGGEHGETPDEMGDDEIIGGHGADTIRGGWGADFLSGGAGNDVIDHRGTDAERIIAERHEFAWHQDGAVDTLDGGDGDDTLIFERGDMVRGGAGEDVFWLYSDPASGGVADIVDFTPGQDFLRLSLNPQIAANGAVALSVSEDGLDGLVQVDGATVAVLRGAPDATLTDLYVETRPDVFA